jgi:proline dehydrogenase
MSGSSEAREFADGFLTRAGRPRGPCGQGRIGLLIIALPMGLMRSVFLAGSQSRWLRERAVKYRFVHRAVSRFMPGEDLDAALAAANDLKPKRIGSVLTYLGENVKDLGEAEQVTRHYLEVLARSKDAALDAEISVKLTQLGLDLGPAACETGLMTLVERAAANATWVWIDMESSAYTDATLDMYRRARERFANVGVCVQAYLRRTEQDLKTLIPLGGGLRLVKGAYREPPEKAYPSKRDVDANYFSLATRLLGRDARQAGVRAIFGTHDPILIRRIEKAGQEANLRPDQLEFQMLYGIRRDEQARLAAAGHRFRVLISYGDAWFPWYMRRLAERPANVLFVVKNLFAD